MIYGQRAKPGVSGGKLRVGGMFVILVALGPAGTALAQETSGEPATFEADEAIDQEAASDSEAVGADQADDAKPDESETAIFSRSAFSVLVDARVVAANGEPSWVDGGFGKTRFQGDDNFDYRFRALPTEVTLAWMPRFSSWASANVSASWQRDQQHDFDLIESYLEFLPVQHSNVSLSARLGLMWPEISLEHSTGGAWSVVNTITPSAINSWIGEEVKVVGAEWTLHAGISDHQFSATGALFGFNDTSGTLLSFRGWALHDLKATAFGHFPLPPLNDFMSHAQEDRTRSLIELDDEPGFYGRLDWRPPWPFGAAVFYYDNRGDPEVFNQSLQWGWRTRFWNLGINADLGPRTRLLAQGMTGTTIMGFRTDGVRWVRTRFRSAYALISHQVNDKLALTGRAEAFDTRERGSQMSHDDESERGLSWTGAARYTLNSNLNFFLEALNVRSRRGRRSASGLQPLQAQTVIQLALRFTL